MHHIQQPNFPLLTQRFLHYQLQNNPNVNPNTDHVQSPDLSNCLVSVFCSAIATFYAPSNLLGLGGMHSECIQSTPCWQRWEAHYNTVFLEWDPDVAGMGGLHVGRVFLFFSFCYDGTKYPCALVQWFSMISDGPDEDTGMWVVQPDLDANGQHALEVIHVHSILHGAHLIPIYGQNRLALDTHYADFLDTFQAYYVNKYIDHHAFEIAF